MDAVFITNAVYSVVVERGMKTARSTIWNFYNRIKSQSKIIIEFLSVVYIQYKNFLNFLNPIKFICASMSKHVKKIEVRSRRIPKGEK